MKSLRNGVFLVPKKNKKQQQQKNSLKNHGIFLSEDSDILLVEFLSRLSRVGTQVLLRNLSFLTEMRITGLLVLKSLLTISDPLKVHI